MLFTVLSLIFPIQQGVMETSQLGRPMLFPCADRVKVPQIGADIGTVSPLSSIHINQGLPLESYLHNEKKYSTNYLKRISEDLTFSEEVVKSHASHSLPYDKTDLKEVFRFDRPRRRRKKTLPDTEEKLHARGWEKKHIPCHIHKLSEHKLTPLKVPKFRLKRENQEELVLAGSENLDEKKSDHIFLTESLLRQSIDDKSSDEKEPELEAKKSETWDSQLLMKLSKNTARWIVSEKTLEGAQKERLEGLLDEVHGVPSGPIDTLIRDDASVSDLGLGDRDTPPHQPSRSWKHSVSSIKAKTAESPAGRLDTRDSEPLVSFYRLPFGMRKLQRELDKEAAGAINATAKDLKIYRRKAKPPPTLRDVMNPAVGDKMFDTDNQFEQEWLSGAQQLFAAEKSKILLNSGNLYQIYRQQGYPINPEVWLNENGKNDRKRKKKKKLEKVDKKEPQVIQKGQKRWSQLPVAIEEEVMNVHEPGYDPEAHREPSPSTLRNHRENPALVRLGKKMYGTALFKTQVDEWRSKWNLSNKWYDSSVEDLERDLKDLNEHVRLQAVATIARASTFRPQPEPGVAIKGTISKFRRMKKDQPSNNLEGILPERLVKCVELALKDPSLRVRFTAAITLYTLNRPNEEARSLLNTVIRTGTPPERWAAAQCLAHAGVCDSYVVGELVNQLFSSEDIVKHEQCVTLMAKLSQNSSIVHSMVAEQLNSTSWRRRIVACKVLPRLHGIVNKDITHKLTNLMWNDWHKEVRTIAAQTLGKTGHGKVVHNDLRDRLLEGSERDRIDSLYKIGHLGIMTARLLPAYLKCFDDVYISVRIAATNTAAKLELKDEKVLNKLLFLTQFDSNWKVKAHAIKALGLIGEVSERITDAIVWALRFETEPGVRAEACESLVRLGIKGDNISAILQDKLLVEPDELVRKQLAVALEAQGVSSTGDMEMVQQIKDEVRRLCTRFNIAAKITKNEEWQAKQENHREMFSSSPHLSEFERKYDRETPQPQTRPSTKLSQRTQTPTVHITSEDDANSGVESPDFLLPQTPNLEEDLPSSNADTHSRRSSVFSLDAVEESGNEEQTPRAKSGRSRDGSPHSMRSNNSRLTPAEKLEKLIEVYEGTCSYDEYEQYVRPQEAEEEDGSHGAGGEGTGDKDEVPPFSVGTGENDLGDRTSGENIVEPLMGNFVEGSGVSGSVEGEAEEFGTETQEQVHVTPVENK
ncbi:HEAT repeat-containing protein 4 [Holothuria leucospilota]|uniref:HEAT repeat-containing protein 4 n=1 Tax=Holothuria leucospilota TaxID=206669 RepID=A0A9Q0YSX8_HOLLE|nr:HEAT repeat-containing protein 4 [Holothuria leucospilota]